MYAALRCMTKVHTNHSKVSTCENCAGCARIGPFVGNQAKTFPNMVSYFQLQLLEHDQTRLDFYFRHTTHAGLCSLVQLRGAGLYFAGIAGSLVLVVTQLSITLAFLVSFLFTRLLVTREALVMLSLAERHLSCHLHRKCRACPPIHPSPQSCVTPPNRT